MLDKRDMTSKHFLNEDGSFSAVLAAGPIHYKENGQWKDIDHKIKATSDAVYSYANTTNLLESYFGTSSVHGVRNRTEHGEVREFLNGKMYWEVGGQAVSISHAADVPVSVSADKAYYNDLFGNINAEFIISSGRRQLNYIIPNAQVLSAAPSGTEYLVFSEDVELPHGWTYAVDTTLGILLKDASGNTVYTYEKPVSTDATETPEREVNTIMEANLSGNILTILTKVKTAWLLDSSREFPVKVDPTVNVYPGDSQTGQVNSSGGGGYGNIAFGYSGGYYRGYATFNTSTVPVGSTITQTVLYHYCYTTTGMGTVRGSELRAFLADPEDCSTWACVYNNITDPSISPNIYQTAYNFGSQGWKNSTLGAVANTHLENRLSTGDFTVGYRPAGSYSGANQYALLRGFDHSNKPYLAINYTVPGGPPSCATLLSPANGATGTSVPVSWNTSVGATGYDVYFGTSSNPPLVSTNQTGTSYTVSGCLSPATTYYWKVIPKNADGAATGCATWSFTTDAKLLVYKNDWETANEGYFGTSGASVDGWYTNNNSTNGYGETNTWTVSSGTYAINGKSVGVSALVNYGYAGQPFQYYQNVGVIFRWIYRPMNLTGLRDIEVSFSWRCGGEPGYDFGEVISSINGGSNWLAHDQGGLSNDGKYSGSPTIVRTESVLLPATRNNQNSFVLGFKWTNDASGSTDPSFVVDDIFVKACPYEGVISSTVTAPDVFEWEPTGSTETTLTITGSHSCAQYAWEQSTDGGNNWVAAVGGSGASTVAYTTPDNITTSTWYRCRVYYGTACSGAYQDEPFKIGPPVAITCQEVDNPTIAIGNPANGLNHHLELTWDALTGATGYDVEVSTTGVFTGTPTTSVSSNSFDFNAGDNPNKQYYFRVRATDGSTDCDWTDFGSLYTAADVPALPTVGNATGSTLDVTLVNEIPVNNPAITT